MKRVGQRLFLALCFVAALGCGSGGPGAVSTAGGKSNNAGTGDDGPPDLSRDGGPEGDGGADGAVDTFDSSVATFDGGDMSELGTPQVAFVSPTATDDPSSKDVITSNVLTVRCSVTRATSVGSADVDQSSVRIFVAGQDGTSLMAPPVNITGPNEYEAMFELSELPNGPIAFRCEAKDLVVPPATPQTGFATLRTLLDLGPVVKITSPTDGSIHPLIGGTSIQFKVTPAPLASDDPAAATKTVTLVVAGTPIKVTASKSDPTFYQTVVDFNDETLFKPAPVSAQIIVTATNGRKPKAGTRERKVDITVDAEGPAIAFAAPGSESMQHGDVTLRITATDPAGIQPGSVIAKINGTLQVITSWKMMGGQYVQTFDTRKLDPKAELTQLTLNVSAKDSVGNVGTAAEIVRLDNLPPVVSLDPPWIREYTPADSKCTVAFDPVGDYAANDLEIVPQSSLYRAMVEDRGNSSPGALTTYLAGTDTNSVTLYAQHNAAVPLVIDEDHDGVCDEINDEQLSDMTKRPVQRHLSALTPKGAIWFSSGASYDDSTHNVAPGFCNAGATVVPRPQNICTSTDMYRVINGRIEGKPPAIYALNPTNGATGECEGGVWELSGFANEGASSDGWWCIGARATDAIGNVGIAEPIRVCIDDNDSGNGTPDCSPASAPNCGVSASGGCMITNAQRFGPNEAFRIQP